MLHVTELFNNNITVATTNNTIIQFAFTMLQYITLTHQAFHIDSCSPLH